jgi:hypothetical protein
MMNTKDQSKKGNIFSKDYYYAGYILVLAILCLCSTSAMCMSQGTRSMAQYSSVYVCLILVIATILYLIGYYS